MVLNNELEEVMEDWKAISVLDRAKKGYDYNDDVRTAMDRAIEALYFEMRARELFDAVIDLLVKQRESDVVLNLLTETVHYDEEECDGYCLMEDICHLLVDNS